MFEDETYFRIVIPWLDRTLFEGLVWNPIWKTGLCACSVLGLAGISWMHDMLLKLREVK